MASFYFTTSGDITGTKIGLPCVLGCDGMRVVEVGVRGVERRHARFFFQPYRICYVALCLDGRSATCPACPSAHRAPSRHAPAHLSLPWLALAHRREARAVLRAALSAHSGFLCQSGSHSRTPRGLPSQQQPHTYTPAALW